MASRLGRDPLQIQGPGGNVSLKSDGAMWVKASGTWLADAEKEDIFAAVDGRGLKAALRSGDPRAKTPELFPAAPGLRPSIETTFHAALDAPVVIHTHCVATIAHSVVGSIPGLEDLDVVQVPYAMPGIDLARAVLAEWRSGTRAAVLANHGLITTGATVAEAEALLREITHRVGQQPVPASRPAPQLGSVVRGSGWKALGPGATTALAFDNARARLACDVALFPDQVIFLGPSPMLYPPSSRFPGATASPDRPVNSLAILEGLGAAVPETASPAAIALAEMMGEVVFRIPPDQDITRLNEKDVSDLLGWDAEKYRQALEKERALRHAGNTTP
ncbi:MAG: class II aldolase/adducin family protein [Pseudomonadota bacterium]